MRHLSPSILLVLSATVLCATSATAQSSDPLPVCIGADRVVRYAPAGHCGAGETLYHLSQGIGAAGQQGEKQPADLTDLTKQIDFLKQHLAQLEQHVDDELETAGKMSHQVMAPFEVLDKQLKPIFVITEPGNDTKRGLVTIRPAGGGQNYAIQFRTASGQLPAQFGIGKSGAGILAVTDAGGKLRGELWGERGLEIYSSGGNEVASLSMDNSSNGALQLNSSGGAVLVTAGGNGAVGTVYVGPRYVCTGDGGLRTPSCIQGRLK